jgi:hypothetical protein
VSRRALDPCAAPSKRVIGSAAGSLRAPPTDVVLNGSVGISASPGLWVLIHRRGPFPALSSRRVDAHIWWHRGRSQTGPGQHHSGEEQGVQGCNPRGMVGGFHIKIDGVSPCFIRSRATLIRSTDTSDVILSVARHGDGTGLSWV